MLVRGQTEQDARGTCQELGREMGWVEEDEVGGHSLFRPHILSQKGQPSSKGHWGAAEGFSWGRAVVSPVSEFCQGPAEDAVWGHRTRQEDSRVTACLPTRAVRKAPSSPLHALHQHEVIQEMFTEFDYVPGSVVTTQ